MTTSCHERVRDLVVAAHGVLPQVPEVTFAGGGTLAAELILADVLALSSVGW